MVLFLILPVLFWLVLQIYKQNVQIKLRWALFVTYTIIQSIMRSEMCSLHLTHPSGAVFKLIYNSLIFQL